MAEADRLLVGDRAAELFVHFATSWWELESVPTLEKDRTLYRTWTDAIPGALAEESRLFLTDAWTTGPTLDALLAAPTTYVNATLATFYGLPSPAGTGFQKVALDPARGSGMLTQGSFLAEHAKPDQTSPTLRGKFVMAQLFCTPPAPPPPDIVVRPPTVDPRLSTRERFAQHTTEKRCADCHVYMDPLGFAFEHFDQVGLWRDTENGLAIDSTGEIYKTDAAGKFNGAVELSARLAQSRDAQNCYVGNWMRFGYGREPTTQDACSVRSAQDAFTQSKGNVRELLVALTQTDAFLYKSAP